METGRVPTVVSGGAAALMCRTIENPDVAILPTGADPSCWQYAQLTIIVDGRAVPEPTRTVLWHGPGPGTNQDCSDSRQTVSDLLTRFGADDWELVGLQEHREGVMGSTSYWDAVCSLTTYTFKTPSPFSGVNSLAGEWPSNDLR
jgi:hypothetical protein